MNNKQTEGFWTLLISLSVAGIVIMALIYYVISEGSFSDNINELVKNIIPSLVAVLLAFIFGYYLLSRYELDNSFFLFERIKKEIGEPINKSISSINYRIKQDQEKKLHEREEAIKLKELKYDSIENMASNIKNITIGYGVDYPIEDLRKDIETQIAKLEAELKILKEDKNKKREVLGKEIREISVKLYGLQKTLTDIVTGNIAIKAIKQENEEAENLRNKLSEEKSKLQEKENQFIETLSENNTLKRKVSILNKDIEDLNKNLLIESNRNTQLADVIGKRENAINELNATIIQLKIEKKNLIEGAFEKLRQKISTDLTETEQIIKKDSSEQKQHRP